MTIAGRLRLGLDCSTSYLALALVDGDGATVVSSAREVGRLHAALVTIELTELFARAGAPRSAVSEVRVGIGPGSYTGVRVAVAAAKGLGRAWNVDVRGVYSLLAQAGPELGFDERGLVTSDARKGNVYVQPCTKRAGEGERVATIVSLGPPKKVAREGLAEQYPDWRILASRPPDAAVLAASGDTGGAEPLYL
ncbi:MAG TPA: tRNA (adenosine(37)-N6)-threonylcarbamoyltransferase complex dimerization subunit type 1 TsaB [Trueperaceae bacterium]|nr:tRNA (adenosine(37)-N6)-threonylcarbamoyltransferase complex dimerization subunit type 1 TsaB [Trueperaceae bacterium]